MLYNKANQLFKYSLVPLLLSPAFSIASEYSHYSKPPVFKQSLIQKADNTFYIALGGGGAYQQISNWNLEPGTDFTTINDPNENYAGAGVGLAAIGYGLKSLPVRMEVAYNYIGQSKYNWDNLTPPVSAGGLQTPAKVRVNANTFMYNLYVDFWTKDNFAPYITGGVGYSINTAKLELSVVDPDNGTSRSLPSVSTSEGSFAWNAGLGLQYLISENWSAGIQVNYVFLGKVKTEMENVQTGANVDFMDADDMFAVTGTANIAYHF